jgi:4-hydroxybenzoate polyprenyltransferase/phosphoserine phosphatase
MMDETPVALCIDLDGTLVRSDLLLESALRALRERPAGALAALLGLVKGRANFKRRLALLVDLRVDLLPYRPAVVALAESAQGSGRPVVLATASNRKYADQVAAHLGVFDSVQASDDRTNLSAHTKAQALVRLYGEKGYDYVGDSHKDLEVWRHARRAIVVEPQSGVLAELTRLGIPHEVLSPRPSMAAPLLRALRPHQWLKNALVFVPLLTAHLYLDAGAILATLAAFVAFSLTASAGYLINDLLDLDSDRQHSRKRRRPLACGDLPLAWGLAAIPLLAAMAAAIGALLSPLFLAVLLAYFATTLAYSLHLKRRPTLDTLTLASLYTLRVIGGAVAIGVALSFWLLAFSMFLFLSLAYLKRYAELESLRQEGVTWASGRGYGVKDLELVRGLGIPAGYGAVLVLALYINSPEVRALYHRPEAIWLICPILLYWIARTWSIAHRGLMHDDPLIFAIEDRGSQLTLLTCIPVLWLAL